MKGKPHYGAKKAEVDGIRFQSRKEAARYAELKLLERAGEITELVLQPEFPLLTSVRWNGQTLRKRVYKADFQYREALTGVLVIEDVKGYRSDFYKLKRHMFLLKYGTHFKFIET